MFTTGSKLFIGATTLALAGTLVFGISQDGSALGTIGMVTATMIFAFLWDPLESTCRHASLSIL